MTQPTANEMACARERKKSDLRGGANIGFQMEYARDREAERKRSHRQIPPAQLADAVAAFQSAGDGVAITTDEFTALQSAQLAEQHRLRAAHVVAEFAKLPPLDRARVLIDILKAHRAECLKETDQ